MLLAVFPFHSFVDTERGALFCFSIQAPFSQLDLARWMDAWTREEVVLRGLQHPPEKCLKKHLIEHPHGMKNFLLILELNVT